MENMSLNLSYFQVSNRGWVRDINEDFASVIMPEGEEQRLSEGCLFALADGLGGQPDGEIASREAIAHLDKLEKSHVHFKSSDEVEKIIRDINQHVYTLNKHKASYDRMATTLTVSFFYQNKISIGHVGDCRVYRIRGPEIRCLTQDHSAGPNALTRAIGLENHIEVDYYEYPLEKEDIYIQCSDGLHSILSNYEIFQQAVLNDPRATCMNLIDLAMRRGGPDNITVQTIQITS
jgi:protein phosphatase